MKRILFLVTFFLITHIATGQTKYSYPLATFKIDTLFFQKDTSNLFVREIWDTTTVKTFYCSADSADKTFRYGFLYLKKGLVREYSVKNIRGMQAYPRPEKYKGLRIADKYPVTIRRII